ncbi:GNAT family N-acetyltransferase [Luteipulveratus mongoliensis]|uniref:N-acetyltransferase domain-containing protein n=1 Tax=Luteipulveratus mongoliensis TaxID=571913 RepID=A0A0K1JGZ6_9MICO|nr:GNAT family N-acetyltransferase [Luteipulveratus mongoliensis]AKU15976.1 hypothetical protein VV02_09110 [Luteipulveratus mongoliensis]
MAWTPSDLSAGWATDLAILELNGSVIDDRGDHLVVTTPSNPQFHWGNFVLVTDPDTVDQAGRWVAVFEDALPQATWRSIGLPREPSDRAAWHDVGVEIDVDEVLAATRPPRPGPLAAGYTSRALVSDDDWSQLLQRDLDENARSGEHDPSDFRSFAEALGQSQRAMSENGSGAWFGAFDGDGGLVAELGIVACGARARYQRVGTDPRHRRRGLASHLLGVAAQWSASRGCDQWVIVTGADNPAGRVYRSVGFEPSAGSFSAYRLPPR